MADTKTCNNCHQEKLVSMFYMESNGQPRSRCIACFNSLRSPFEKNGAKAWSAEEDEILKREYPKGGPQAVKRFVQRDIKGIKNRAYRLGICIVNQVTAKPAFPKKERSFGIPADTRPDSDKALDYVLRSFRECEPAQNLTWILSEAA